MCYVCFLMSGVPLGLSLGNLTLSRTKSLIFDF